MIFIKHHQHVFFALLLIFLFQCVLLLAQEGPEIEGVTDVRLVDEIWMSNFINAVQTGYTHSKVFDVNYHGNKASMIETERMMRAKIRGHQYEASSTRILIVGEKNEPLFFKVVKGSGRHEMITEGRKEGDMMIAEKHSPWSSDEVNIPLDSDVYFVGHQMQATDPENIEIGRPYMFKILDIEDLQVKEWTMTLLERRPFEPDSSISFPELDEQLFVEKWSVGENIVQYWKDGSGNTWRREEGSQYSVRTTEEEANDFSAEHDIWENIAFASDKVILNSKRTDEMKIQFKVVDVACDNVFSEDERLRVLSVSELQDTCQVLLMSTVPTFRETTSLSLPLPRDDWETYLEATPYIQSDDTAMVKLAAEIVGDEGNAYRAAVKLSEWVHFHVDYQFLFTNVTARDVLQSKSGDCSEFSLLYTALARAAGIPTRQCQGIVYGSDGEFYRHAWAESWVGEWVALDPTWNEHIADATHLKFGEMYATTPKSITPVDIRIIDYQFETEGRKIRMSAIDLDLGYQYNDTLSTVYSEIKKRLARFQKRGSEAEWAANLDTLRRELAEFISAHPKSIAAVEARRNLAETFFLAEEYEKAITELESFIDTYFYIDEELTGASLRRIGECYLRQKQYDQALDIFRQVKERFPEGKAVGHMVIDVEEIAHHLWNRGRYAEAIVQYEEMMDLFPARKTIYQERLADIHYSRGDYDEALDQYKDLITLYPNRKTIYNEQIALLYRRLGRIDEAILKFEEMMDLFPERKKIYLEQIAETYSKADKFDKAVETYLLLLALYPEREIVYQGQIAKIHQKQGNYEKAVAVYEEVAGRHPDRTAVCYEQIAKIFIEQRMYEEAVAQYEHLVELFPERKMIYGERIAVVFEKQGLTDEAIAQYRRLIQDYPDRESIYAERIEKLSKEGNE
jgi:tetratricopeptide (TPR) repeat protein